MSVDVKFGHVSRESGYVPRLDEQLAEHATTSAAFSRHREQRNRGQGLERR